MNSSIALSESDLLALIRAEAMMIIDSIAIIGRTQPGPDREVLKCDLLGGHSSYGSAVFDFRYGRPLTDQVLDTAYGPDRDCRLRVILYTDPSLPSDPVMPAASLCTVREFVCVMNAFGAGIHLVQVNPLESGNRRFNVVLRPAPDEECDRGRLPVEKVARACEFWDIYFYSHDTYDLKSWSGLTEIYDGNLGYGGVAYDNHIVVFASWDEKGLRYEISDFRKERGSPGYIGAIWRRKSQDIKRLFPSYAIDYSAGDSCIQLKVAENPLDWLLSASPDQKMTVGHKIHSEVNLLLDSVQHVVRDCNSGKCTREAQMLPM